jgi:DNA polymerase III delta prime subunit
MDLIRTLARFVRGAPRLTPAPRQLEVPSLPGASGSRELVVAAKIEPIVPVLAPLQAEVSRASAPVDEASVPAPIVADLTAEPSAVAGEKRTTKRPALGRAAVPEVDLDHVALLSRFLSETFVTRDNRMYSVANPNVTCSTRDVKSVALDRIKQRFPDIELSPALLTAVYRHALETLHNDPSQRVNVWDGTLVCRPDIPSRVIFEDGFAKLNTWSPPPYRNLGIQDSDLGLLPELLAAVFVHAPDREVFLDWLSWSLQHENQKPRWAVFLFSAKKGTGKSTLCDLARRLFGESNTTTQNGVAKLTGRFNAPILQSKLVISEEVELAQGSSQANTLKTYITEEVVSTEVKGREVQQIRQVCCLILTSNHMPLWLDPDDRRYYVIDCEHEGHASGQTARKFRELVARFRAFVSDDAALARLYNALMQRQQQPNFDAMAIDLSSVSNPLMQHIQGAAESVLRQQMQELLDGLGVFAIGQEDLLSRAAQSMQFKASQLKHVMADLRWKSVKAKWGSVDYARSAWVHPDYAIRNGHVEGPNGYRKRLGSDPQLANFEIIRSASYEDAAE